MAVKRNQQSAGIGGALIMIVFIILTVTVFSVLTLVSSQNELGTVKKSVQISESYYAAEKAAAIKCGEIKALLKGVTDFEKIKAAAEQNQAEAKTTESGIEISFKTQIDENRSIKTVLIMADDKITLLSQTIVSDKELNIDDGIDFGAVDSPFA